LKETAKTSPKNAGMSQKRRFQARKQQTETNKQSRQAPIMADECKKNTSRPSRIGGANYQFKSIYSLFRIEKGLSV